MTRIVLAVAAAAVLALPAVDPSAGLFLVLKRQRPPHVLDGQLLVLL